MKRRGQMNRLESSFAKKLDEELHGGKILWWAFESVKFSLGSGAWFCPDFVVMTSVQEIVFYETKGFMREAANVRLKVAANKYPFRFMLVRHARSSGWTYEEIGEPVESIPNTESGG